MSDLSEQEFQQLLALARRALWQDTETRRRLQAGGVNLTPANFYSSVPLVSDIEQSFEYAEEAQGLAPYAVGGLFDDDAIRAFTRDMAAYAHEFDPPVEGDRECPDGYFWNNPAFSGCDAMAYYCVLRMLRPRRVLEIGAGFSTLVADMAIRANGSGEIVCIEPYPRPFLHCVESVTRIIEAPVQGIPVDELVALVESSQVWFIDSTHTVKIGSDCLYLYLKVMPQVATEVTCHSHDVCLPYAMPRRWALEKNVFWTEQYLLQAYLLDNPKAEVLFGSAYLKRTAPEACEAFMQGRYAGIGGSLWYRLNGRRAAR
jgi:hypothetical protein